MGKKKISQQRKRRTVDEKDDVCVQKKTQDKRDNEKSEKDIIINDDNSQESDSNDSASEKNDSGEIDSEENESDEDTAKHPNDIDEDANLPQIQSDEESLASEPDDDDTGDVSDNSIDPNTEVEDTPEMRKKRLLLTKVKDYNEKMAKKGVVYLSRIPPKMTPGFVRSQFSAFGEIGRIYLVAEDDASKKRRKRMGSSGRGVRYTEGWVEFLNRKHAKKVARWLNTTPISNKKSSAFYGDLWSVKFLKKFQWDHLTEKVSYERRVREYKLRMEMLQVRRENLAYMELAEKGHGMDMIQERRKRKGKMIGESASELHTSRKRKNKQIKPMRDYPNPEMKDALKSLV